MCGYYRHCLKETVREERNEDDEMERRRSFSNLCGINRSCLLAECVKGRAQLIPGSKGFKIGQSLYQVVHRIYEIFGGGRAPCSSACLGPDFPTQKLTEAEQEISHSCSKKLPGSSGQNPSTPSN